MTYVNVYKVDRFSLQAPQVPNHPKDKSRFSTTMTTTPQPSRVLLVEDDIAARALLGKYLWRAGFEVSAEETAENALASWRMVGPYDVVVSDVHLPGMSGLDLTSLMLKENPAQSIVLITGDPDEALAYDALSRGPVQYLLKPFELFELEAAVRQAVAQTATRRGAPPVVAAHPREAMVGVVPSEWLTWADDRSYAGSGHADRVSKVAALLYADSRGNAQLDLADLEMAAQAHELGVMLGRSADPVELASRSADLLDDLGSPPAVSQIVRQMHERWDGSGGPAGLRGEAICYGARLLAASDAIDHFTAALTRAGVSPEVAVERAIGLVLVQQGTVFSPEVARAISRERVAIQSICAVPRRDPKPGEFVSRNGRARTFPGAATDTIMQA